MHFDPLPVYDHLLTGSFRQAPPYAVGRPNGSNDYLLFLTVSGRGTFTSPTGLTHPALPGTLHLYPPRTPQDYRASGTHWTFLWAHFQPRPHWLPYLAWGPVMSGARSLLSHTPEAGCFRLLARQFREVHTLASNPSAHQQLLALAHLELLLLSARLPSDAGSTAPGPDPRVHLILTALSAEPARPLDIPALAESVALSTSRLQHLFKQQTRQTLVEFLESQRIAHAKRLLSATSMPVKQVAAECGYASQFYFSLRFKRATGRSPSAYRNG